ncbi:hypothetical protein [Jeotgalibacillus salarius]|uniref:Uncharacterized protein n=1 Tax=Jeotgalibacillus salarius TaxID=546023 RepID=A0A4Y8LGZ2_9BACL|nr:hypothetical protein [Jeotgalibacillus salarius]TFD99792.1 hypothetical protein E2626_13505 [Jeotgalibacillus salarius]
MKLKVLQWIPKIAAVVAIANFGFMLFGDGGFLSGIALTLIVALLFSRLEQKSIQIMNGVIKVHM